MRQWKKRNLSPQVVLEALELINEICNFIHNKKHMNRAAFYLETLYDMIWFLEVQEYLQLLSEGGLKEEFDTKASTSYIRVINNCSVGCFARQIGTCVDYFVKHKQFLFIKHGVHDNIDYYIDDKDIRSTIMVWMQIQRLPQQPGNNLGQSVVTEIITDQGIFSTNTAISCLNNISFNVADTDKKKGSIYVNRNERSNVVGYRNRFWDKYSFAVNVLFSLNTATISISPAFN